MSRYFVTDPPVAVAEFDLHSVISETPPNVIWIKARMDVETKGRVQSELISVDKQGNAVVQVGANSMALLIHNIVRWEGPDLGAMACTPANIRTLDPNEPHIALVLEEIATRNKEREAPIPKSATAPGLRADGLRAVDLAIVGGSPNQSVSTMPPSALRSALTGRLNKSGD